MNLLKKLFRVTIFLAGGFLTAPAQLAFKVSPREIIGQKTVVKPAMKNGLMQRIESARAVCFLLDDQGNMVGQSTRWVIGQNKTGLDVGATNTFNFVITSSRPFATTNLTARITFSRIVLNDGALVDFRNSVTINPAEK